MELNFYKSDLWLRRIIQASAEEVRDKKKVKIEK